MTVLDFLFILLEVEFVGPGQLGLELAECPVDK
jgi:hypothetical protein